MMMKYLGTPSKNWYILWINLSPGRDTLLGQNEPGENFALWNELSSDILICTKNLNRNAIADMT